MSGVTLVPGQMLRYGGVTSTLKNILLSRNQTPAVTRQSFGEGPTYGSATQGRRREPGNIHVSPENDGTSGQQGRRKPTPIEDSHVIFGARRRSARHGDRQPFSPAKRATRFGPSSGAAPEERRAIVGSERTSPRRRAAATKDLSRGSVASTRDRVRDLQALGGPQWQNRSERSLAAEEKRQDDPRRRNSAVFVGHSGQVLSLAHRKDILFSAAADGTAKVSALLYPRITNSSRHPHLLPSSHCLDGNSKQDRALFTVPLPRCGDVRTCVLAGEHDL